MDENSKVVMTVPEAGRKLELSRNAAYEAAARGEIPTIRIGKLLRVPMVAFDRMLEQAGSTAPSRAAWPALARLDHRARWELRGKGCRGA